LLYPVTINYPGEKGIPDIELIM
jgi:hypothetical protein